MLLTIADLMGLEDAGIIEVRGFSGKLATVEDLLQAPTVCQVHAAGKVFDVVVNGTTVSLLDVTKPALPPAGLGKDALLELACQATDDKEQWYTSEVVTIAEDAYLKNDGDRVRLYQVDPCQNGRYPMPKRLAEVLLLDPMRGWVPVERQPLTAKQAMEELFDL